MLAGAGVLTQLLLTVAGVLAARMLGVEGRGQVVLVATLAAMGTQLTLGGSLPNAITKMLAQRGVTARDGLRGLVRRWVPLALGTAAAGAAFMLYLEWDTDGLTKWGLALGVALMALQGMASRILVGAMLGEGSSPVHIALTSVLPQALVVAVFAVALTLDVEWNAVELMMITIACTGLVLIARLRVLAPATGRAEDRLDGTELAQLARRTHFGSVGPIDGLAIDRTLVGWLLGNAMLGLYSAAFALGGLTNILGSALGMVALPRVSFLQSDPAAERHFVRRWLAFSAGFLALSVLVLELVTEPLIRLTFGPDFVDATACARWILVGSGLLGYRRVLIAVLQGRDRGGFASWVELALTPVVVVGILASAHEDSLVGVGVTMTVVGLASCLVLSGALLRSGPSPSAWDAAEPQPELKP
jgi:O-antigen/teichoic acid export membrane protein